MTWATWIEEFILLLSGYLTQDEFPTDHLLWNDLIYLRDVCNRLEGHLQDHPRAAARDILFFRPGLSALILDINKAFPNLTTDAEVQDAKAGHRLASSLNRQLAILQKRPDLRDIADTRRRA